ncbi:hypothetical protein VTN02DRAFT_4784 [Thermoascus thermophilus]
MSRAEKFEDEKRRIVQSCFSKQDADGSLVESYITHVRVTEDAAYPSSPAPPNSPPENKKHRIIIVAVRRSGRVRMHKARENNDGSFSIGKTWMLDDLVSIQSYGALVATTQLEQQQKLWASNVGFVVTIGKPYYWQAATSKEKDFFIASLVKIYKKYTGGKVPNLVGFDDRERQLLAGAGSSATPAAKAPSQAPPLRTDGLPPPRPPSSQGSRPQSPHSTRAPSRDGHKERRHAPDEPALRHQRSREHTQKHPHGHSAARQGNQIALSPLAPASATSPWDQPPPRSNERREGDKLANVSALQTDPKTNTDSGVQQELRPPPSRDGKAAPELKPLRTHDLGAASSDREALRPTTPADQSRPATAQSPAAGSFGPRSPLGETNGKTYAADARTLPRSGNRLDPKTAELPNSLRPGSSGGAPKPPPQTAESAKPPLQGTTTEPTATEQTAESAPTASSLSPPEKLEENPEEKAAAEPAKDQEEEEQEVHRPGLGPMVKKKPGKDIAGAFRKAATAYGAFKPRAGGAAERLMAAKSKNTSSEPDGITGVVPAPLLRGLSSESTKTPVPETTVKETSAPVQETSATATVSAAQEPPKVEVTQAPPDQAPQQADDKDGEKDAQKEAAQERSASKSSSPSLQERRRKRREDNTAKYCQALGIDPSILGGRGVEFDDILTDLGWNGRLSDDKKIEDLEADVRREIGRVQASSWLGNIEHQEGKVDQLAKLIDKTIEECEVLDGLLTLYSHELNTLDDDVAYIEAQSQGLQVQTANQKLLQNELQNLLKTLSISSNDLRPLREASLSNPDGVKETEAVLSTLYKAMLMIDSDIRPNKKRMADSAGEHGIVGVYSDTEVGQMRAIKEKKEEYRTEARLFVQRLRQFMNIAFKVAGQKIADAAANSQKDPMKLDSTARDYGRQELWMYNALMLFAREVSTTDWYGIIGQYELQAKFPYQNEFRENTAAWKQAAKKASGFEHELLFTHQDKEKESDGLTTAARRLTVRRGKTIRMSTGLRLASAEKQPQTGRLEPCEVFAGTLHEMLKIIADEQNFVVQFFHLDSLSNAEFPDLVSGVAPEYRRRPDFSFKQSHDPDRDMAKRVEQIMDDIYSFWPADMENLADWVIKTDQLQTVGVLFALEKEIAEFEDTNQEFIVHSLQKLHSRLSALFNRFIDDQIRGIEETKVKINKRKGVISFMRVFPNFSAAIENILAQPSQEFFDIRISVNDAYNRINRAMWESLKFIAKEAPGQQPGAPGVGDPEDKEALNYHILIIENMNHYIEEVDVRGIPVLERWRGRAIQDLQEHTKLYVDAVIRRPLGKLLDFVESTESLLANTNNPTSIAARTSHSRSVAKKVLAHYELKEFRRGIELLRKRVEKHFGDGDDPGHSRNLVVKVLTQCEARYADTYDRIRRIIDTVYEGQLDLEWRKEDAIAMFKR